MKVEVGDVTKTSVELLPERAILWENNLIVADLHWGKTETFQSHGVPLPSNILSTELSRLLKLSKRHRVNRVIVLGDLIHSPDFLGPALLEETGNFFREKDFEMVLIEGNHDRRLVLPENWDLTLVKEPFCEKGLAFCHHADVKLPEDYKSAYTWSGHLHPTVVLEKGKNRLRLPCFIVGSSQGVMPAFSDFTRGIPHSAFAKENRDRRFFAIAEKEVIEL